MNSKTASADSLLKDGLAILNIEDTRDELFKKLKNYSKEILLFNRSFNLLNLKNEEDLIVSHILDSLSAWKFFHNEIKCFYKKEQILKTEPVLEKPDNPFCIADIGSGAGFPGVVLSCLFGSENYNFPQLKFALVERMERRCSFLQNQKAILNLANTEILNTELERLSNVNFDIVTCRAFRTLDSKILKALLNCTKKTGKILLYKATKEKINEDLKFIKEQNLNFKIEKLNPPFSDHERHLIIIETKI